MDQLKPVIEFCKKQYFWILLTLLSLVSIAGFVMTKMSLSAQLKTQQSLVDSKYSSVQEVASKASTHPNENSHKEMDRIVGVIAEDVRKAWELQYLRQVKIMQWPNSLGPDFVSLVDKYRPIETLQFPLTQEPLGVPYRERFRDYVDPLFPRLAKIIGANWEATVDDIVPGGVGGASGGIGAPTGSGAGRMSGPGGMDPGGMLGGPDASGGNTGIAGPKPLVYWQPNSQKELMQNVLWWHDKKKVPSTLEILYTQEDLWIIEGLMNIIKATNGDAQESFQAAIKEIEFLRIGKSAVGRAGNLTSLGSTGNMGMGGMGGMGGSSGMPTPGGGDDADAQMDMGDSGGSAPTPGSDGMGGNLDGGSMEGGAATPNSPDPAAGRYVDTAFQPIAGEMLRTVVSSGALNPTDAPLAVAKRVPVRMRFKMDQRKLNRLLTECGNADLLFEIRQVRINTEAHGDAGAGGMMGAMGGGRAGPTLGGSAGAGGIGAPDEGSEATGGSGAAVVGTAKSYDLPVEIYGIVYLFNPVDMNKLGIEKVTADTQIENVGRVSAEESTGIETDQSATTDGGTAPANPANPATPPTAPGEPASPPATPTVPDENAAGGVTPDGSTSAPAAPAAPATTPPAGAGTPAAPALPSAG